MLFTTTLFCLFSLVISPETLFDFGEDYHKTFQSKTWTIGEYGCITPYKEAPVALRKSTSVVLFKDYCDAYFYRERALVIYRDYSEMFLRKNQYSPTVPMVVMIVYALILMFSSKAKNTQKNTYSNCSEIMSTMVKLIEKKKFKKDFVTTIVLLAILFEVKKLENMKDNPDEVVDKILIWLTFFSVKQDSCSHFKCVQNTIEESVLVENHGSSKHISKRKKTFLEYSGST